MHYPEESLIIERWNILLHEAIIFMILLFIFEKSTFHYENRRSG